MPLFAGSLCHLAVLDVTLHAGFAQVLDTIVTRLRQLHSLIIAFVSDNVPARAVAALSPSDVARLAHLRELRQLRLTSPFRYVLGEGYRQVRFDDYGADGFGDDEFSCLIMGLPRLRSLDIDLEPSRLTWRTLTAVAMCRMLETLALRGYFHLLQLKAWCGLFVPMFPHLATLRLHDEPSE
jgi:hypothetical protein